ncbi:MAG: ferritin family protein [Candidatus Bathyarchaeota archaeon]|nr:MAG: ferritin family protein [Candidatus Bathyarchaeota archaeon]
MVGLNLKAILESAVKIEEQSYALYTMAQRKVSYPSSKSFFEELAQEELRHKEKLLGIMENKERISELGLGASTIQDLKIVDMMKATALSDDVDYQRILIYAAKREKSTYEYYNSLALGFKGTEIGEVFSKLAQEELKHKNRLEREYDEYVLTDN